jgi:hypothetical protein
VRCSIVSQSVRTDRFTSPSAPDAPSTVPASWVFSANRARAVCFQRENPLLRSFPDFDKKTKMIGLALYVAATVSGAPSPGASVEILSMPWAKMYNVAISEEFIEKRWGGTRQTVVRDAEFANRVVARIRASESLPKEKWPRFDDLRMLAFVKAADGSILSRVGVPRFCNAMHVDGARYTRFDPELFGLLVDRLSADEKVMIALGPKECRLSPARRASGVAPGKPLKGLGLDERTVVCDWRAGRLGGYGRSRACGGAALASGPNQDACVQSLARLPAACAATVSTAEACTNELADGCPGGSAASCRSLDPCRVH